MKYKIHETAKLFPLLEKGTRAYKEFDSNIRTFGQLEPIVVDGDVLLDGRNRLAICEENGVKPKVVEWSTLGVESSQDEWIFAKNWARRHLSEDQRAAILTAYILKSEETDSKARKERKPNSVSPKSDSQKRDNKTRNANRTSARVAQKVGVSRYKAEQVIALAKAAEAGGEEAKADLDAIKAGQKTIHEVTKKRELGKKPSKAVPPYVQLGMTKKAFQAGMDFRGAVSDYLKATRNCDEKLIFAGSTEEDLKQLNSNLDSIKWHSGGLVELIEKRLEKLRRKQVCS